MRPNTIKLFILFGIITFFNSCQSTKNDTIYLNTFLDLKELGIFYGKMEGRTIQFHSIKDCKHEKRLTFKLPRHAQKPSIVENQYLCYYHQGQLKFHQVQRTFSTLLGFKAVPERFLTISQPFDDYIFYRHSTLGLRTGNRLTLYRVRHNQLTLEKSLKFKAPVIEIFAVKNYFGVRYADNIQFQSYLDFSHQTSVPIAPDKKIKGVVMFDQALGLIEKDEIVFINVLSKKTINTICIQ